MLAEQNVYIEGAYKKEIEKIVILQSRIESVIV